MKRLSEIALGVMVVIGCAAAALNVTAPGTAPHYGLFELNIAHASGGYTNVWEDVSVTARFTSPSGTHFDIDGFFDTTNTWSVRFCPAEMGTYTWRVRLAGSTTDSANGTFQSAASAERGFVRQHATDPFRLVYEKDGGLFNGMGFGTCFRQTMEGALDRSTVPFDVYVRNMIDSTGFQLVRVSVNNCAPKLWQTIQPGGNIYLVHEVRIYDAKIKMFRAHNARIMLDPLGWMLRDGYGTAPSTYDALKRYWRYVVARYAALVDMWELCNESTPPDAWITEFSRYVKSIDPYGHMVSVSWERPDHPDIDINAPHQYWDDNPGSADGRMAARILQKRGPGKPIIYGEIGNGSCSEIADNALQASARSWGAFFAEGSLIWWEQNGSLYCPNSAANLYIGPQERRRFRAVQKFAEGVDPAARPDSSAATVGWGPGRVLELRSDSSVYLYVHRYNNWVDTNRNIQLTASIPAAGTGHWISAHTGDTIGQVTLSRGTQTFTVPPFVLDVAFKLEGHTGATDAKVRAPGRAARPTPAPSRVYDLRGRLMQAVPARGVTFCIRRAP